MPTMPKSPDSLARPYRSHKVRACDHCRKRKSRCTLDIPGRACVMCRVADVVCCYDEIREGPRKRARVSDPGTLPSGVGDGLLTENESRQSASRSTIQDLERVDQVDLNEKGSEFAHIVGPILANDAQVVEQFMLPETRTGDTEAPYNVYSSEKEKPILYTKVCRRRPGFRSSGCAGAKEREILEQILGPFANELVDLYAKALHSKLFSLTMSQILQQNSPLIPHPGLEVPQRLRKPRYGRVRDLRHFPPILGFIACPSETSSTGHDLCVEPRSQGLTRGLPQSKALHNPISLD